MRTPFGTKLAENDATATDHALSSIEEPLRQIVENAGEVAAVVLNQVKGGKGAYGYIAGTGEYGDMIAGAPKEDDHAHSAPGGGMGGMGGMNV